MSPAGSDAAVRAACVAVDNAVFIHQRSGAVLGGVIIQTSPPSR